jgi:hypothetical protein
LGDCEQIISCQYNSNKVSVSVGSIDDMVMRKNIVTIMEGGVEAFEKRKLIYELWNQ